MLPDHQLLCRVRRGHGYGRGRLVIGNHERMADAIKRMPFNTIAFDPVDHFGCQLADAADEAHWVPPHRIRAVFRDGALIWQRPPLGH